MTTNPEKLPLSTADHPASVDLPILSELTGTEQTQHSSLSENHGVDDLDWESLRARSLLPGGFGEDRSVIWPKLLGVPSRELVTAVDVKPEKNEISKLERDGEEPETNPVQHRDERQIRLDTDRSFVLYPAEEGAGGRDAIQEDLHNLIVSVFRKWTKLNYFQGYHDIVSVLFLTLPPELRLACAEKLSLHRLRDSMGQTLEPVLGLLRITKNLIRIADPDYADVIERTSPLPFYALSNLLTLFSHDVPTLPLIQHIFDWLLSREPLAVVYLAAVMILHRKGEIEQMERDAREDGDDGDMGMAHSLLSGLPALADEKVNGSTEPMTKLEEAIKVEEPTIKVEELGLELKGPLIGEDVPAMVEPRPIVADGEAIPDEGQGDEGGERSEQISENDGTVPHKEELSFNDSPTSHASLPSHTSRLPPTSLSSLLTQADALYSTYSPTHPALRVSAIMGPQSVVFTWNEKFDQLPSDKEAEDMVGCPSLVVYPYIEEGPEEEDTEGSSYEYGHDNKYVEGREKKSGKGKEKGRNRRRKWPERKPKKSRRMKVERRMMVAGAVLFLGIAMAIYGARVRGGGSMGPGFGYGFGAPGERWEKGWKDWKKMGGWIGGTALGIAERVMNPGNDL